MASSSVWNSTFKLESGSPLQKEQRSAKVCIRYGKLFLCLINHHAITAYGGEEVQIHTFLTWSLDRNEWETSCPSCLTTSHANFKLYSTVTLSPGHTKNTTYSTRLPFLVLEIWMFKSLLLYFWHMFASTVWKEMHLDLGYRHSTQA
jgi:hypothetical protein